MSQRDSLPDQSGPRRDLLVEAHEEIERLRWALREACDAAWSDGEAAMAQYLRRAETAALDEERRP